MKAILLAPGHRPDLEPPVARRPDHLFPFLGKPFVQHVVEYLVERGIQEIHFLLSHLPRDSETLLGDGTRWGCRFEHHLARDEGHAINLLRVLAQRWGDETVLLGNAVRLPALENPAQGASSVLGVAGRRSGSPEWTGWAWTRTSALRRLPSGLGPGGLLEHLLAAGAEWRLTSLDLDLRSWDRYLASLRAVLAHRFEGLAPGAREVETGVWIGRNVALHPSARVERPVFLAENVRVESGAVLGPYAVIEAGSIVAPRAVVQDAAVWPDTYVGEGLDVRESIVDRNCLVHVALGTAVEVRDDFLLGSLRDRALQHGLRHYGEGLVAALLLLALGLPMTLAGLLLRLSRRGPAIVRREVLALPASPDPAAWQTMPVHGFGAAERPPGERSLVERLVLAMRMDRLPALWDVFRGRLALAGTPPRTAEEARGLPPDWQALYLESRAGIATLAEVEHGACPGHDELYSAEAYHAVRASFGFDLGLFFRWWFGARTRQAAPDDGAILEMQHGF